MHLSNSLTETQVPPSPARIYNDAARLARRLQVGCEVSTPEFNAAPLLWRIVRLYQGPRKQIIAALLANSRPCSQHLLASCALRYGEIPGLDHRTVTPYTQRPHGEEEDAMG